VARIKNDNDEQFGNAQLKLVLKKGKYSVNGGIVSQEVNMGDSAIIYVTISIPARKNIEIKAEKSN
jgi:hypothetical protein